MKKDIIGQNVIDIDCFCSGKGCYGNLYIQPDIIHNTKVFMVTLIGTSGAEQAYMWLSAEQLEQLQTELNILIQDMREE